ncbi:hypothetical protein Tco_0217500 [Tanacetum coccineum]
MAIPNTLIYEDIRSTPYYPEYVAKVTKYQRYLAGEVVSDDEAPAPKPGKGAKPKTPRKPKPLWKRAKGKEKVNEEQAAQVLLNLQTPKNKNLAEQFIFQRRTPAPTIPSIHEESSSLYVELGLTDSESEFKNEASREGQAGSDPGKLVEGQAGLDLSVAVDSRIQPSHVVHAGPNLEHMNLEVSDTFTQQKTEPASSNGTMFLYKIWDKDLQLHNQFLAEKSHPDEPEKTNNETEVQSMVTVPIHQDTSSVPLMTMPVFDLTVYQLASTTIQPSILTSTAMVTTTDNNNNFPPPHITTTRHSSSLIIDGLMSWKHYMEALVKGKSSLRKGDSASSMLEENYDKGYEDHRMACEALQTSILRDESEQFDADKSEERKKMKRLRVQLEASDSASRSSSTTTISNTYPDNQSPGSAALGSSKTAATTAYTAWTTTTSRFEPSASSIPEDVFMHEESDFAAPDMVFVLSVPTHNWASAIASSYVPPPENSLLSQTNDIGVFIDWFCKKQGIIELTPEHLEGPAYEVVKAFHLDYNVSRPLLLGGPLGHVTIQTEFFFNRDLDYLRFGSKGDKIALSITKMKAAYYPDVGLEQMVPD